MNPILADNIESYLYSLVPERDEVLRQMEAEAGKRDIPIVGPLVGHYFFQLAQLCRAKTVFEMGSAIGYSTIWWARAIGPAGRVVYTDSDERNASEAQGYFKRAGLLDRIQIEIGDACEVLERQRQPFDILFNDIDKKDYPRVFSMAARHVKPGGIFVTDNVLWSGQVVDPGEEQDEATQAIVKFNDLQAKSEGWMTTILPLRDGVSVSFKL